MGGKADETKSALYDEFYYYYMENKTTIDTLERLAAAGKLTRGEVDGMVAERLEKKGFDSKTGV